MKLKDIEKLCEELKNCNYDSVDFYLTEIDKILPKLLAVAKAAKEFDKRSKWLDGLITEHEDIRQALNELEMDE